MCILKGLFKGNSLGQADAMQAYIQAKLGGTETWVEIPEEGWPEEWRKNGAPCERPCMRLIQALYGHPDSGTFWEKHADKRLLELGFIPAAESWPSCYLHEDLDLFLVLYVDDFLMSGPEENMDLMWKRIGEVLNIEDAGPMGLYLGCIHEEGTIKTEDGKTIRTMTFNQEGFFREKVENILSYA